jgi:sugar-specific transcriptional regulator TrmB
MSNISLKKQLIGLNFTDNEALVYESLFKLGPTFTGQIIKGTGLHRNIVYTSLDHLVARKLASEKIVRGKKQFTAVSPVGLVTEFEKKTELAKALTQSIVEKLPQGLDDITIHQGNEEYLDLLTGIISTMPRGSTKYVLGTGGEAFMANTMRRIWKPYHKAAEKQGIKIRMLAYELQRQAIVPDITGLAIYKIKFLPNNIENPSGLHIYPEAHIVLNIIYSDNNNPVTAIKIKNFSLVQGYLNLFNNLWQQARD